MVDQRKVIAVVDNEQAMLKAIGRLLAAHGFEVLSFGSAEAFLDSDRARAAECLLLDINLDGMSGIELRRRLKAVRSRLPVIFMTAMDDDETQAEATDVGCVRVLRKPFRADCLIAAITTAMS